MAPVAMGGIGAAMAKQAAIKKILGRNKGGMGKVMKANKGKMLKPDPTKPISSVPPTVKTRKKFKSLEEMRKAKGFRPGETAAQFNKRQELAKRAVEAARATRIGKNCFTNCISRSWCSSIS